jgi:hypothetical protein
MELAFFDEVSGSIRGAFAINAYSKFKEHTVEL